MIFPRILSGEAARAQDVFQQLQRFERLDRARQREISGRQLSELMRHAHAHSPFWRARLERAGFEPENGLACLARLPVLKRADLQEHRAAMRARGPNVSEDGIVVHATSGTTGEPVAVEKLKPIYAPLFIAATLLDHHRQARDFTRPLGIYAVSGSDSDELDWGAPANWFGPTGRAYQRCLVQRPVAELYDALVRHRPHYVRANPTVIRALSQVAEERGVPAPAVGQFMSWAGPVTPELRLAARKQFGARIAENYSCQEVGYISQQCARHDHHHVMSALTMVEIVGDDDRPCPAGVTGRVLVSSLHSFAMPILRYEVGDLAQWGPACDCGVQTPVIERILGRTHDLVSLPDGSKRFISFSDEPFAAIAPIREYKVVLHADGVIEFIARPHRALGEHEKKRLAECLQARFDHPFRVVIREVEDMPWSGYWKRRDFVQSGTAYGSGAGAPGIA